MSEDRTLLDTFDNEADARAEQDRYAETLVRLRQTEFFLVDVKREKLGGEWVYAVYVIDRKS